MSSYYRQQLESWLEKIDVKADRVLDVGGGALSVKSRVKSWDVKEYKILDNESEEMKYMPDIVYDLNKRIECDCGYSSKHIIGCYAQYQKSFDIVFCLEVFEYIWNPYEAVRNLWWMLKPGGVLYISFPFVYPHHNPEGHDYLRYTQWGALKLLKKAGFNVVEVNSRVETCGLLNQFYSLEKMHPAKKFDGHHDIGYMIKAIKK